MGKQTSCGAVRAAIAACALLCAPLALGGCTAPSSYAGIPLAAGAADPQLQALARRAQAGDRTAQLELGRRYELGQGVAENARRACEIYQARPAAPSNEIWLYSPSARGVERHEIRRDAAAETDELALRAYRCRAAEAASGSGA